MAEGRLKVVKYINDPENGVANLLRFAIINAWHLFCLQRRQTA